MSAATRSGESGTGFPDGTGSDNNPVVIDPVIVPPGGGSNPPPPYYPNVPPGGDGGTNPGTGGSDPDPAKCSKCQKHPCICVEIKVRVNASVARIDAPGQYDYSIYVTGKNIPNITKVLFKMQRKEVGTSYTIDSIMSPPASQKTFVHRRTAMAPGNWGLWAHVYFEGITDPVKSENTDWVVEEFPPRGKFMSQFENYLKMTLWNMSVSYATLHQAEHKIQEYGCNVFMRANGSFYLGPIIPGLEVVLDDDSKYGRIFHPIMDEFLRIPTDKSDFVVGVMHVHYPVCYATENYSGRYVGPSGDDDASFIPGILCDYANDLFTDHGINDPIKIYTYGPSARRELPTVQRYIP